MNETMRISRRAFIRNGSLLLAATGTSSAAAWDVTPQRVLRAGLVTDLHYADKPTAGSRHYRETPEKLAHAADQFDRHELDFIVELGDFIDAAESVETELGYLKTINDDFSAICKRRHYVLGNHCVHTLNKREFLDGVGQTDSYYSFDVGQLHFVVLDACFRGDGEPYGRKNFQWTDPNIPEEELDWLADDLRSTENKTVVFAHQRLDVSNHYGVKNASAVRDVLEASKGVLAVFQGHSHANDYREINDIHYCTLVAMVEGSGAEKNGFSLLEIASDGSIELSGFVQQQSYRWP